MVKYYYNYITTNLDLMLNMVTMFGKKNYYPVNVYLIGGVGLNYAWDNDEAFARNDKLLLAYDKLSNKDDWSITVQAGVAYKFGYKKKPVEPKVEEVWATRIDTIWYDDVEYKDVTADRDIKKEIFFAIRKSDVTSEQEQISAVAEFLKGVKNGEITITAYADKGTGKPKLNMKYSKLRAEKTKQAIIEKGVDPNIIKSIEWKGDTVQPFPENDKNRCVI